MNGANANTTDESLTHQKKVKADMTRAAQLLVAEVEAKMFPPQVQQLSYEQLSQTQPPWSPIPFGQPPSLFSNNVSPLSNHTPPPLLKPNTTFSRPPVWTPTPSTSHASWTPPLTTNPTFSRPPVWSPTPTPTPTPAPAPRFPHLDLVQDPKVFESAYLHPRSAQNDRQEANRNIVQTELQTNQCRVLAPLLVRFDGPESKYVAVKLEANGVLTGVRDQVPDMVLNFHADTGAITVTVCKVSAILSRFQLVVDILYAMKSSIPLTIQAFNQLYDEMRVQQLRLLRQRSPEQ